MGLCASGLSESEKDAIKRSQLFDMRSAEAYNRDQEKVKMLLLGAGESGKSTIFKQMKHLHGVGFQDEDKMSMTPVIYNNTIVAMKVLITAAEEFGFEVHAIREKEQMKQTNDDSWVDETIGTWIRTLWDDEGIQRAYAERSRFQLIDSASYYFSEINRIMAPDYVATFMDILKSRVRTSGIIEESYYIDGVEFIMYDVGGQRNERKKWIHCFDDVKAVIFVAALSEYDQVLYEDSSVNRMAEALTLFEEICNCRWFRDTDIILFLNKRDLFEDKIKRVSPSVFSDAFPDEKCTCGHGYPHDDELCSCGVQDNAKEFFRRLFFDQNQVQSRKIFYHVTTATDTNNIKIVFESCKEAILRRALGNSGFFDDM
eukprot:TRINITY_DN842_c0_g1_i2.p1 TRINITY_DN842_c0_g1~~TRINITY_DN842_c0_g1_i2.p1  ORF type:complete len:371 (-),score=103.58 TRINITY_DN842_c0_g1_i2:409-1521(-)